MTKKDASINRGCISRDYLLDIANKDGAYGYVSAHEIINAPCYKMQGPCEDCQYREWLKGEIEPKTVQEKQADSEKYQKAFDDGYNNGYAQARFDYEQKPKTDIFDKIKAEIHASAVMKPDHEWYVNEKRIMQIIDRYRQED